MADVFLSYAKEDQDTAAALVSAFEAQGLSVWWDDRLDPSQNWDRHIELEIAGAKAVVVLWTKSSVESEWVRIEANYAKENRKLLQIRLDDCAAPLAFSLLQRAELAGWKVGAANPNWTKLLAWLSTLTGCAISEKPVNAIPKRTKHEEYREWWNPVLQAKFRHPQTRPVLHYPNNIRISLPQPKSWLLVTAFEKDGVAIRLVICSADPASIGKLEEDIPVLCDVLPDGTTIREGHKNDVWLETVRDWHSFSDDSERRAWLVTMIDGYVEHLWQYFSRS